jgi:hypothetical protein
MIFDYRAERANASAPFVSGAQACVKVAGTAFAAELQQPSRYKHETESGYRLVSRRQCPHFGLLHTPESEASATKAQDTGDSRRQSPTRQHH